MWNLEPAQYALAIAGALIIGLAKTGLVGLGGLAIAIFANILPARQSTGAVLPMLICADIVAVAVYRRHAVWKHLWRLFPWAAAGIVAGFCVMNRMNDAVVSKFIGIILIVMVALHWRRQQQQRLREPERESAMIPQSRWFAIITGLTAGFTTMLANAAGPVMVLYLLAMRLPKMEFLGTGAWYFLILNIFKVPFSHQLGLIHADSLRFNLMLAPFVILGALGGRSLIRHVQQDLFEKLTLGFTLVAAVRLLL